MKRIVILGGGTGGTLTANRLRRSYDEQAAEIVVVDHDADHVYQPGLLFVPFGLTSMQRIVRPRREQFRSGISFRQAGVDRVDVEADRVYLDDGTVLGYDVLVVATGARLLPEETDGLTGPGWLKSVFTFYTPEGAVALHRALERFTGGRLVVNVVDMPIKCPVAPLEFCFLADYYFRQRGIRDRVELTYVTPLDGAFTKPVCNRELSGLLADKGIELVTEFNTGTVEAAAAGGAAGGAPGGRLISYDERVVPFDLAVVIPLHGGAAYVERSPGLGDELGFIPVDPSTLQAKARPNVFALGDATDVPTSKAGSVAHFEGDVLAGNVRRFLAGQELLAGFARPHQLLHRDRLRQGAADRLQLRHRAASGPLPGPAGPAAAPPVPPEPPRQAGLPAVLLAQPAARPRRPRHQFHHARPRQDPPPRAGRSRDAGGHR